LSCVFFKADSGNEPVRDWLRGDIPGEAGEVTMNKHLGSTLDSLFEELGELEEVNARAAKKILSFEAARRMAELGVTKTTLAERMHTSRKQIDRILDEDDAGITLKVLFRLARALEMPLQVGFGAPRSSRPRDVAPPRGRRSPSTRRAQASG
jgi:antitoxin HicB